MADNTSSLGEVTPGIEQNIQPGTTPQENGGQQQRPTMVNYAKAFLNQMDNADVERISQETGLPVKLPDYETFKGYIPDLPEQDVKNIYDEIYKGYAIYDAGKFDRKSGVLYNLGKTHYTSTGEFYGWNMREPEGKGNIPMDAEFGTGPGFEAEPIRLNTPDQIAEEIGYFLTKEGTLAPNTFMNRLGRFLATTPNPDPSSPVPYFYREVNPFEAIKQPENIRSIFGPQKVHTPTVASLINARAFVSELLGTTLKATGGTIAALTAYGQSINSKIRTGDWRPEDLEDYPETGWAAPLTAIGNSLTNLGAYMSQVNMDESEGAFSSASAISNTIYGGLGQLMSIALAGRISARIGMSPRMSMSMGLGLGGAQNAAHYQQTIIDNGGSQLDAAMAWMSFFGSTILANMVIPANIAERTGIRRISDGVVKNVGVLGEAARKSTGSAIGKLPAQSKSLLSTMMSAKGINTARNLRYKVSSGLTNLADKKFQIGRLTVPIGYNLGMGLEEFVEEGIEELFQMPLENAYNKHLAVPRAKEVNDYYSKFLYDVERSDFGTLQYVKYDRSGKRIELDPLVWRAEQDDLLTAQNILKGDYTFDAKFSWDEPFAALISSFIGGTPIYYVGGAHKARKDNDVKYYRQSLALDIARKKQSQQANLMKEVRDALVNEQQHSGIFGADFLTPDGQVITDANKAEGLQSVAEVAIGQFMQDLALDVENIQRYGLNNPQTVQSLRQNNYLYHEALDAIEAIRKIEAAIAKHEADGTLEESEYVRKEDTIETVKERLGAYQEFYRYITEPKDGPGGKRASWRYSELHFSGTFLDFVVGLRAKKNVEKMLADKGQAVDPENADYKTLLKNETDRIKKNQQELWFLSWTNEPSSILNPQSGHKTSNIWSFLNHVYKKMLGAEMEVVKAERNALIKAAKTDFANIDTILEDFEKSVSEFREIDMAQFEGENLSAAQRAELEGYREDVLKIQQSINRLSNVQAYNEVNRSDAKRLTDAFNSLLAKVQPGHQIMSGLASYAESAVTGEELAPGVYAPSAELSRFVAQFSPIREQFESSLSTPGQFQRGEEIGDLNTEQDRALVSSIREEAYDRLFDGINAVRNDGGPRQTVRYSDYIADILQQIENPHSQINNGADVVKQVSAILHNLKAFREILDVNANFLPQLSNDEAEHSMLNDGKSDHLYFTEEEFIRLSGKIDEMMADAETILASKKLAEFNRELDQTRFKVNNLSLRNYFLGQVRMFFAEKAPQEFDRIFMKEVNAFYGEKDPADFYHDLFEEYYSITGPEQEVAEKKKEIADKLLAIEKAIIKAEEALSGKLDDFIKEQLERRPYMILQEFGSDAMLQRSGNKINGSMTVDRLNKPSEDETINDTRSYFLVNHANIINRFGRPKKSGEKTFTISEVLQAFREVTDGRNVVKEKKNEKDASEIAGVPFNVTTYEQEQLALHVLGFLINPDASRLTPSQGVWELLIQKALYVRGYAGTGKTTQLLMDVIQTYEELTGKEYSVSVIVPTQWLQETHKNNFAKIGKGKFKIQYVHNVVAGEAIEGDLVIVDEGGLWKKKQIQDIRARLADKTSIWLGDDAQTPPKEDHAFSDLPIRNFAAERTDPITEVFRSGNPQHFAIQDYFRALANGSYNPNMPKLNYDFLKETGLLAGGRYYGTENEMRDSFLDQFNRLTDAQQTLNNIIYIVPRVEDRQSVIDYFEKKLGREKAQELSEFVLSVEFLSNEQDYNHCISGLSSAMVFFEFEANKYANQIGDTKFGAIDLAKGNSANMFKRVGRPALTGSSRATMFLGLIGNPELSEAGSVPTIVEERKDQAILAQKKALVDRLINLTDGKTTYRGERTQEKTSSTSFNRALMIDPLTKEEIASSPKFKLFKSNLQENNQKNIEEILDAGETLPTRATNISLLTESVQKALKNRSTTFDHDQSRIRHAYFSSVVRYLLTGNEQFANEARGLINELNDYYKSKLDEKALKKALIQNPEAFFVATVTNVQTRFDLMLGDPLTIFTPTVFNDKITVKGENGETQEMLIEGHPLALRLVGYDQTGKPIVDLEELVIHNHINSYKGGVPGAYTKAKVGSYVALLTKSGMVVNRVMLNNYLTEGATLDFLGANQMSDADIVEGLEEVKKAAYLNNELQIEEGQELATSEQFFNSRRIFSDPKFPTNFNFVNDETGEMVTIDHVAQEFTDGKWVKSVFYLDENNKVLSKDYDTFLKEFVYIKESEEYYDGFKHKTRAEFYTNGTKYNNIVGAIQNHTLVLPLTDGVLGQSIHEVLKSNSFKARVNLLGKISKMRSLEVDQVYNDNFENTYLPEDSDIFTRGSFRAVITTELSEDFMQAEAGTILKKTLVEAGIIKAKAKTSNEEIVRLFKENRFHILGIQNDPEHTFRSAKRGNISVLSFPEAIGFINATTGEVASEQFKRLEERILLGFKGDENEESLVRYNLHKLIALRHLKMLGRGKARIADVEIGNMAQDVQTRNGQDFINEMVARGFKASPVKLMPVKDSIDGRAYFFVDFTRDNFPGNRRVIFDAVKAQPEDITGYIDDVKALLEGETEFKRIFDDINKLKSKAETKKMSKTQIDQLREMFKAAVLILESRPGFQFLKANRAQLRTLEGEIRKLAKKGTVKIDGKVKKAAGILYEWNGDRMFLLGEDIQTKFLNLISVLQAVKSYYSGALAAESTDVSFRKNPFLSAMDEGHITAEGKVAIDPTKLETNIREIKTPEIYVRPENQENYEDMVRSVRANDETPAAATPGKTNETVVKRNLGPNLEKQRTTNLPFDTVSAQEAVNEANRLIGEANAQKYFQIKPFEIVSEQDKALFGRLINNIIELSGYDVQGNREVHARAPRHELMHLIMNHILNESENQKVLDNIQEILGESWDGTMRHLYEYAAEQFEYKENIQEPKNWFEKFIFFLKRLANRIGFYRFTFNEMLTASEMGYYQNAKVNDLPNHDFDTLEKAKDIDGFDNQENLLTVVERFGTPNIYSYYRDQVLANRIKSYLSYGRSLLDTGGSFAEALYRTRVYYKKRVNTDQVEKTFIDTANGIRSINELTPQDFVWLHHTNVAGKNNKAIALYVDYMLSDHFNLMHMVKELFPNTNLNTAERVGRVMAQGYNATRLRKQGRKAKKANTNVSSAAKNIHADAETQNPQDRISDELGFVLSTVPLYSRDSDGVINPLDRFLHNRHVQKIFTDTFRRLLNNYQRSEISFRVLMEEIERIYQNELEPGPIRDAYYSVWLEFGTEELVKYENGQRVFRLLDPNENVLHGVGYLAIAESPERYNNIKGSTVDFRNRLKPINDLFSAIISHFGSVEVLQQGIVNLDNGRIEQRSNTSESLLNYLLKQSISGTILDEQGVVHAAKGKMLTPGEGEFFIQVTPDGFSVYDHNTQKLTPLYSIKENINVESVAQLERIFSAIGLGGYKSAVLRKMLKAKNRERGERSVHNILHSFLLATKVNYEMGQIINEVIGVLNSDIDELRSKPENKGKSDKNLAKDIEWVDIEEVVLSKLDAETRAMYDYLVNKYYKLDKNEVAKFKMETRIYFDPFEQVIYLPSPLDFHTMTKGLAEMMVEVNLEEPRISINAEGERVYTQSPASLLTELQFGSESFIRPRRQKVRYMAENQIATPFVTTTPEGFRINNPFFSDKVAFDKPWTLTGAKYLFRGSNYQNLTEADLMVVMLRELFAYEVTAPYAFGDVSVIMSPFADKVEAKVLPFFLKSKSQKGVAAEHILTIGRNKARKITSMEVNYDPFVDAFEDLVNYYRERREKSIRSVAEVLRIKESKLREYISNGSTIFLNEAERKRVESSLTLNRDYVLKRNEKPKEDDENVDLVVPEKENKKKVEYIFIPGKAITQEGIVFNEGFAEKWFSLKTKKGRYNLLKRSIAEDFLDFAAHLRNTGVWSKLISDDRLGASFFSTFKEIEMDKMVFGRIEESESDMATEAVNPALIGSRISETIIARRNKWLKDNGYRKDGTKVLEGEPMGEPMTMADFNAIRDTEVGADVRKEMASDRQLSDDIKKINKDARKIEQQYTTQSVEAMDKVNWSPALEAFYMTYWLANESIAHITRGDATIFSSPSDYIKRGAGFKAPGTFFDLNNPYGIGQFANVAVLRDIPGFNTFLGVTAKNSDPELFTNGHSKVNPVWFKLLQRSAGGNLGVVGDFATKTVVYGNDIIQDNNIYFKFSQLPIDSTHYRNSALHKGLMKAMLGEYALQFEAFLSQNDYDFDRAVELMADWVVDPKNADEYGVLPREKMISYIVHPSAFKNGLTGLQDYEYFGDGPRSAFNVMAPESLTSIMVPNEFMRLQTVNNGDGNVNLHSFATQLFGVLGVMEHNLQYAERFNSALTKKIELFNQEVGSIINSTDNESLRKELMLDYLKKIVLQNAGRSTRGSKMEKLLKNPEIVGDVFSNKFFESFISHLNDFLKPDVMGNNMPQQSAFIRMYEDERGQLYLPSDLGLADDEAVSLPHKRRLLRPMSYVNAQTGKLFTTREELQQALENDPEGKGVVTVPAEIIAKFHYAKEFDLADDISLHDVMDLANGETLYETGFQRVTNQGAANAEDMSNRIVQMTGAKTIGELVLAFKHPDMRAKFTSWVEALALSELRKEKAFVDSKEDVQDRMLSDRLAEKMQEPLVSQVNKANVSHSILKGIGKYYFDLNNALDIISVRIPTTNASSASIGRFVAFSNTGNSIFTSPEKNILDGSDYDHDELHVFYPTLSGTSKVSAIDPETAKQGKIHKFADNIMFDAVFDFYRDARNNPLTLAPIKLDSLHQYAAELSDNSTQAEPQIINTPYHNIRSTSVNFAGRSLVGHFANQMIFTNRLLSQTPELLTATVNPGFKMVLDPINNSQNGSAVYVEVLDFISKLVNAATDNAKENGLLGRLNINGAVTNLMAGKVLHTVPMTLITEAMEGVEGAAQELQVNVEKQVLDMLQDPHVKKAAKAVIQSNSIFNTRKRKTIWGALKEVGKSWTSENYVNKLNELLDYAYAGEQLNRLGNLFKMTQGMPGDKADFFRLIYQIEKALGQRLETFLIDENLEYLRTVDFSNETSRKEAVSAQVKNLLAEKIMLKDDSNFNEADEYGIREKINIPRIAASNQLILTQLRSLLEFKRASEYLFFNESHPEIRAEILARTGNAELLYQEGFNDYENSIKKALISRFMLRNAPSELTIPIQKIYRGEESIEDIRYNLKSAKEQSEFLANFYDHLAIWKKMFPNIDFLKNIDFEKRGRMSWMTPNFRNSIYIDPLEKAQYTSEFNRLAKDHPEIAEAIRYANLLTFGFSFRNGTFAEVIDDKIERLFSQDYNGIVSSIEDTLQSNADRFFDEIVANGDQVVGPSTTFRNHYAKRQSERSVYHSLFKKVDAEQAKDGYEGQENYILFNHIYPKEVYISDPALPVVTDFVYRNLGKEQLIELRREGKTTKQSSRHTGVNLYEKDLMRDVKNVPFDQSYVYTEFGDLAQVFYDTKNQAEFRIVEDPKIKESRVGNRALISNLSEQTLGAFFEAMQRAFPGIQVNFVDNRTSLTQGIGYFYQGQVYLNKDKLQADTTMHELSHPFVMALKSLRPAQYIMLKNDAIRLLENNDIAALTVAEKYPELSGDDLIDEIISNIVGWESEQAVLNFLATGKDADFKRNSRNLWERFKGRIKNFWNTIKSWFSTNQILIDPEISTIRDLASALTTKALKGEPVFNIKRSDLMNMVRLASDQIFEQKAEVRKDSYGVYDLLMNTGTYMKDGKKHTIKQYRDLDRSERIENIINRLPNMGYVYKTKSGENIMFDQRKRDQWPQIIIDNVLDDYDEFGSNLKEDFISALKMSDFSVAKMVEFFGEDDNGDPIFTELTIKRFLNQVNYHPKTKYMLYSDLPNSDYSFLYDESLVGINPVVAIEHEADDQLIVSLYQLSNQYVRRRDKMSPKDSKNILTRYMRDATARRRGISLESNMGDVSNLLMGIAASEFTRKGKRVKVNQVGTVSIHRTGTHMVLADGLELKKNISAMLQNKDFVADLTPEMRKYFENFRLMTDGFDYESILFNKYDDLEIFGEDVELYKKGELDVNRRIYIYNSRLREILHLGDNMTTEHMAEVSLLLNALATLYSPNVMSDELNTRKDIDTLQKNIFPQFDVNHEFIDTIRRATLSVSQDNVRELQNFKKQIDDFAEFFRNRYEARRGPIGKFIKDTTFKYYDEVLAKVTDQDGNQRFAGHILWTTDANLDPMFYQQAQQADPEVVKWGKFLVDLITEQMAQNYHHMRIMRSGESIWTKEGPVNYTLEMAKEDLFEKTSYKPGMLPLMSETVGSLLSRGKLGDAFGKRLKQIQSSYLQFDDIADLQQGQADALDRLPEMFMRQFDKKNEFEVGSLGLVKARMEDLLGLAEENGQYIFLDKSKRNQNLNTDLETLMEFFKMASIRKINYEDKVLPLINGAVMYMNDLHSNKDFKQENALDYLNLFRKQAIEGKRFLSDIEMGGVNIEALATTAMSYASPLVMALNINVGAVSSIHNFMMAFIEGIGNDIYNSLNPQQRSHWFTTSDLVKASGLFFYDFHKVTQLLRDFQLLNPNEYELIMHRFNQSKNRKQHVFSDFYAQFTNWAADAYARGVILVAQMLRDGSYYAYSYDEKTGSIQYNEKQDRQFYKEDGSVTKEQEVLRDTVEKSLKSQGWGLDQNGKMLMGYDKRQMRSFKALADKYVLGAYGPMEKNMLSQFFLGRMAMMFSTWAMTKISTAFKKGSYIDELGYYDIAKDEKGNLIPKWQREWTEGYLTTVVRMTTDLVFTGNVKQFKTMKPGEQRNWIRYMLTISFWLLNMLAYRNLVGDDKPIPDSRMARNVMYSYGSLLVIPLLWEKLNSPFAVVGIVKRALMQGLTFWEGNWWNLRFVIPVAGGAYTVSDFINSLKE